MSVTIKQVYDWIDTIAPFDGAEEWDNVGILAGSADQKVEKVLCALDLNAAVLDEAIARNVQLIVTHHPILFAGRKNVREDDAEGACQGSLRRRLRRCCYHKSLLPRKHGH